MIKNVKPDADTLLFSEFAPEEEMREAMRDLLDRHRVPDRTASRMISSVVNAMDDLKHLSPPSGQNGYVEVHIELDENRFRAKIDQIARPEYEGKSADETATGAPSTDQNGALDLAPLQERMDEVKLDYRDGFHTTLELIRILN